MSPEEISQLSRDEMRSLVTQARKMATKRLSTFAKNPGTYSPAVEKLQDYYADGMENVKKETRNRLMQEVFRLQGFFNAQSSTVKGARAVMRDQDIRIFGEKNGKPAHRMSTLQRTNFWRFYDEFLNQHKNAYYLFGSGRIQQYLGEIQQRRKLEMNAENIEQVFQQLLAAKNGEGATADVSGVVYSGKGNA